jgi:hypothetical protein
MPKESPGVGCSTRVINLSTETSIKRGQARGRVEQCLSEWVVEGYTIRNLSLTEMISLRAAVARTQRLMQEAMPNAELPRISFKPPVQAESCRQQVRQLVGMANRFAEGMPETVDQAIKFLRHAHYHLMDHAGFWSSRSLQEASKLLCVAASDLQHERDRKTEAKP